MKVVALIERLMDLYEGHGDIDVLLDVNPDGLIEIGEVDVDAEDTGIIIYKAEE